MPRVDRPRPLGVPWRAAHRYRMASRHRPDKDPGHAFSAHCSALRFLRYLGFRRSDVRRTSDRIEGIAAGLLLVVIALAVPVAGAVGREVYAAQSALAATEMTTEKQVTAVQQQDAPKKVQTSDVGGAGVRPTVAVRWSDSAGHAHTGQVSVDWASTAGSTVPIWITRDGSLTPPPATPGHVLAAASTAGAGFLLGVIGVALLCGIFGRALLDMHRSRALDREWMATERRWTSR